MFTRHNLTSLEICSNRSTTWSASTCVEKALERGITQPISVSTYRTTAPPLEEFKKGLPSVEELQREIEAVAAAFEEIDRDKNSE
jgi:hypothetical protein